MIKSLNDENDDATHTNNEVFISMVRTQLKNTLMTIFITDFLKSFRRAEQRELFFLCSSVRSAVGMLGLGRRRRRRCCRTAL